MSYLKRQEVPKKWPIKRKGTKYVVKSANLNSGMPVLVILRDILKLAQNRNEVKKAIHAKNILVNAKPVVDEKKSVLLFDTFTIVPSKQNYRMVLSENGKFHLKEIKESEFAKKIEKVSDKKMLKGKRTQLNFIDGNNLLSETKCKVNDSVIANLKDKKVEKVLPLKEGANIIVFDGKHSGKEGVIKSIKEEKKMTEVEMGGKLVNVLIKQLMVVE